MMRLIGSSRGAVKVRSTGMIGASGLIHDRMAWIRVSQTIRLNAQRATVTKAAPSKLGMSLGLSMLPIAVSHSKDKKTIAIKYAPTKLAPSKPLPEGMMLRSG